VRRARGFKSHPLRQFQPFSQKFHRRYPAVIRKAAENDQITRAILDTIETDAEAKAAVSGSPKIRAAAKAPPRAAVGKRPMNFRNRPHLC